MAKKSESVDEVTLPTADDSAPAPAVEESPAVAPGPAPEVPVAPAPLPFWRVNVTGAASDSFHAVDESDAVRQYFEKHGYNEKYQARVERIS